MRTVIVVLSSPLFLLHCQAADIYVSPSGSDSGSGTISSPYASIQVAVDAAKPGTTIYLRNGTYAPSENIQISTSGTASAPVVLRPYGSETVILNGENMPGTPKDYGESLPNDERGILHIQNAEHWEFYDLELINGPYGTYARDASNNHYERISTHDNYETGFQLEGSSANNSVLYLDSYRNRDPRKNGESADGFACKEGSGTGNTLTGARLWDNVDDGLDLWLFEDPVTISNTYSWGNGYNRWDFATFTGDGNGFKLGGGSSSDVIVPAAHTIRNSIAFSNAKKGFLDNGNPGAMVLARNTAWNNGDAGFVFASSASVLLAANVAAANAGGGDQVGLAEGVQESGNSWNVGEDAWTNASFVSVDPTTLRGERLAGGEVRSSGFLIPVSGEEIGAET